MTNIPLTGTFKVTCEYKRKGSIWSAGYHTGIDLVGQDIIYATCDGQVVRTGFDKSYGNFIVVKNYADGKYHWYCHLNRILADKGAKVSRVSKIGIMGSSGKSTGKHLHFEIRNASNKYGDDSNPATYMGIPNEVGTYNSKDYQLQEPAKVIVKIFAIKTNIRELPTIKSTPHLYLPNTKVEILEENVANNDGYIWDKVHCPATGRTGYVARTSNRYK